MPTWPTATSDGVTRNLMEIEAAENVRSQLPRYRRSTPEDGFVRQAPRRTKRVRHIEASGLIRDDTDREAFETWAKGNAGTWFTGVPGQALATRFRIVGGDAGVTYRAELVEDGSKRCWRATLTLERYPD